MLRSIVVLGAFLTGSFASAQTVPRDTMVRDSTSSMTMDSAPLGIPMQRAGSGTSWLPDATPMHAVASEFAGWNLMLHGVAFVQYDAQGGERGANQLSSLNWGMIAGTRPLYGGSLGLHGMVSAEPLTVGARGYPLLLQSGESYHGSPLHDRQHPHDIFMEIAGSYDHSVGKNLALSLYVAPVGEPAIGPVAFPHRASAAGDPLAPLGHHWQDATHISFGVITAGVYTRSLKLEGSIFNGREPDEIRTNFDYKGRSLDSYASRMTLNPNDRLSLSASYAYLKSPEQLDPSLSLHRGTASAMYYAPFRQSGGWASTLVYGMNRHDNGEPVSNSALAESSLDLDGRHSIFGRVEWVQKPAEDLLIAVDPGAESQPSAAPNGTQYDVAELSLGYTQELSRVFGGSIDAGVVGTMNLVPTTLRSDYGSRTPVGAAIFLRVRPGLMKASMHSASQKAMPMHDMKEMKDMRNLNEGTR